MRPQSAGTLSALASPEVLADWRLALAYEAATSAGVLTALPGSARALAARLGLDEGALSAVLGLLAAWRIVAQDGDGRYAHGPAALEPADAAALAQHGVWIRRWALLLGKRLRDRAADSFETPDRPPTSAGLDLLAPLARRVTSPIADLCLERFPAARRVLDLGGGHGEHALELARRGLQVTMQDQPAVIEIVRDRGHLNAGGVELFAGDLLTTLPTGPFDLVVCSMVTNMFDELANRDLFRRLHPLLAAGGGLVIVSYLRERSAVAASFGLQMLVATRQGDAHGGGDYRTWLADAGFGRVSIHDLDGSSQTVVLAAH